MNSIKLGSTVVKLDSVDSTNSYANRLVRKESVAEGTVILSDKQTLGRGQAGSLWESEPGKNLTFSIVLYPAFIPVAKQFNISMSISNGLVSFLQKQLKDPCIKWPNDIYSGNMKIAGILIENILTGEYIKSSVIGIGLNVNQKSFSKDLGNVSSLTNITGQEFELESTLYTLLEQLTCWINKLYKKEYDQIRTAYLNSLQSLNEWRTFKDHPSGQFEGRIVDVADSGELVVQKRNMELNKYSIKEIEY